MLQVELNTIASSFGCLSTQVCRLHRYIVERAGQPDLQLGNLPANDVTSQIADAIGTAAAEFGVADAAILFVVQPDEKNSYDQQVIVPCSCTGYSSQVLLHVRLWPCSVRSLDLFWS